MVIQPLLRHDFADKGKAVAVHAAGRQTENNVASFNALLWQNLITFNRSNRKSSKVIITRTIHAGHFGSLTADQRTTSLLATFGNTSNHLFGTGDIQFSSCKVIEEQQRLSTLHNQIIDAHGNQVNANRVMLAGINGNFQLGSHAIGG